MDWQNWCRLCGAVDGRETIVKLEPEVLEIAAKLLNIIECHFRICLNCNAFLHESYQFVAKSKLIEAMFEEIQQIEIETGNSVLEVQFASEEVAESQECIASEYDKSVNSIRQKFGLSTLSYSSEPQVEATLTNLFEEGALEIKIESEIGDFDEEVHDALSEDRESIISESSEDEEEEIESLSDIEQLSDSQFKKHEESLQFQDESDSGQEERLKKRRKKYKKTDEEKLFDFICHICKEEFEKMCFLSRHCRKVHSCLPQVNCFCGKQLGTWKRLLIHKQLHFPEKIDFECKECNLQYKLRASFDNHMKSKHGPDAKKFVCSQCARCFKDSRTLVAHEKTHLPDYLKLTHPCEACGKKFVNKNSLKSHITSVHEMANLYTCETCGKGFSTKSNLKSHLYVHSSKKDVQCDVCSSRFKNMDSLRKHKKTHLEKSHVCTICGNRYRNRNNLKAHMVCHSDIKAYQCTFCPNSYKRSKDLKCHLNLHTGERPYTCPWCSRSFVNGSNCRKHKLKDHPDELAAFEAVHGRGKSAIQALTTLQDS